jgi:hypothetical protein
LQGKKFGIKICGDRVILIVYVDDFAHMAHSLAQLIRQGNMLAQTLGILALDIAPTKDEILVFGPDAAVTIAEREIERVLHTAPMHTDDTRVKEKVRHLGAWFLSGRFTWKHTWAVLTQRGRAAVVLSHERGFFSYIHAPGAIRIL